MSDRYIPLDEESIMDYAALLADDIIVAAQEVTDSPAQSADYVSEHPTLVRSFYGVNDVRTKAWIPVPINVSSIVGSDTINTGDLLVAAAADFDNGKPSVEIVLNGAYRWRKLAELRDHLVKAVYDSLVRELSRVADQEYRDGTEDPYHDQDPYLDDDRYYSDKFDVGAFVKEVTDEAVQRAEDFVRGHRNKNYTRDQLLAHVAKGPTWEASLPKLRPTVRAGVLKAVYSALVDAGLV